jgi:hypothetical protein
MSSGVRTGNTLYRPATIIDILHIPILGRLLRWRWGRLAFQIPLLVLAALMIYDGLTGPQLAAQNIATVAAWVHYRGLVILALLLAGNLFCMGCPFTLPRTLARMYVLEERLAGWLNWNNEALILLLIFGATNLLLPAALSLGAAWLSRWLSGTGGRESLRVVLAHFAPAFVPLGFAIWLAHYGFHFATGALSIIPVFQNFLLDHGLPISPPNWSLSAILPASWLLPLQVGIVLAGFLGSLTVAGQVARQAHPNLQLARKAALPWLALLLFLAFTTLYIFNLPMEMRGTVFFK